MQIFKIIAVKDELTQTYMQPVFIESVEEGIRLFTYQINNIALWKDNPNDYTLFLLGTFDQESGLFTSEVVKIANGKSVLRKGEQNEDDLFKVRKTEK